MGMCPKMRLVAVVGVAKKWKKDRNFHASNWLFAQTTHVDVAPWNFACLGGSYTFQVWWKSVSGSQNCVGRSKVVISHWLDPCKPWFLNVIVAHWVINCSLVSNLLPGECYVVIMWKWFMMWVFDLWSQDLVVTSDPAVIVLKDGIFVEFPGRFVITASVVAFSTCCLSEIVLSINVMIFDQSV